ncbi:MAG: hypothetical protein FJ276_16390 [Planctomycetes bacterium]|nr:hypothetical protein [Planctomycetota bacterium]
MTTATANAETVDNVNHGSNVNRLSKLQKQVLVALWRERRLREQMLLLECQTRVWTDDRIHHISVIQRKMRSSLHGEFGGSGCRPSIGWRWQVVFNSPPTRSQCAALSRALRRLEERGLIRRTNEWNGSGRNTSVWLTNRGREVASQRAGEEDPYPTLRDWVKVSSGGFTPDELEARINDPHKRYG